MDGGSGLKASGSETNASISSRDSSHPEIMEGQPGGPAVLLGQAAEGAPSLLVYRSSSGPTVQVTKLRPRRAKRRCKIYSTQQ